MNTATQSTCLADPLVSGKKGIWKKLNLSAYVVRNGIIVEKVK